MVHHNENHGGKGDHAGPPVTHKRQRYPNGGEQANGHGQIDHQMKKQYRCHPIAKDPAVFRLRIFSQIQYSP